MNNNQFRKLVFDTPARQSEGSPPTQSGPPSAFGAKKSSFMPMTPRVVKGGVDVDFARQVRERNAGLQPKKKFKSHAPKGAKYAAGYTDRARAREEGEGDEDDKAGRINALEEQMKLGQISPELFEELRDKIVGDDASNSHLVKGLDRKLLERVRRGEDVLGVGGGDKTAEPAPDVDDELDKLGEKEVEAVKHEKVEKKGMMAPPSLAGKKRSRDEIMAELKAAREAAQQAKAAPLLDNRWRKVGEKEKSRVEIDHKGREVMITVDEDGVVKKKVRKVAAQTAEIDAEKPAVEMPDVSKPVLGSDALIPEHLPEPAPAEHEDDDIFEGVGAQYDPLRDGDDEDDEDNSDENETTQPQRTSKPPEPPKKEDNELVAAPDDAKPEPARRNYFNDTSTADSTTSQDRFSGIENVLKKAAQLDSTKPTNSVDDDAREGESAEAHQARLKRRAQMLAQQDRDLEDMDMGFGGSRGEDEAEEEEDGKKIKLSEWKGVAGADDGDEDGKGKGGDRGKKKRKPKKRKGDVNNAADIMRVIEGRKAANGK